MVCTGRVWASQGRSDLCCMRTYALINGWLFVCMPMQNLKSKVYNYSNYVAVLAITCMRQLELMERLSSSVLWLDQRVGDLAGQTIQVWWQYLVEGSIQNDVSVHHRAMSCWRLGTWTNRSKPSSKLLLLSYCWLSRKGPAGQRGCSRGSCRLCPHEKFGQWITGILEASEKAFVDA